MNSTGKPESRPDETARQAFAHEQPSSLSDSAAEASASEPEPFTELENLYAENAALKDKVLRTMAEMENLRRRTEKEVADARTYGAANFARDMLPFADNLARAIESAPKDA
ncbi:MAG: nucleotide exchange factor GrpE, partial [Hyphomicrobiales bacterium]|nr:nucleotide exchange factor GrpE [Hyphomicrobiales bacterium]